jgi:hypothetical protein
MQSEARDKLLLDEVKLGARTDAYEPPMFVPMEQGDIWRKIVNGLTVVCEKNPAGGTRTYVVKNDGYRALAARCDAGQCL